MAAWIGLFIALSITSDSIFAAGLGLMACGITSCIFMNWRGVGEACWQRAGWSGRTSMTLLLFRRAIGGGGFVIALVLTATALAGTGARTAALVRAARRSRARQ